MWIKIYITVFRMYGENAVNTSGNASFPDMFKNEKKSKLEVFSLPCCLVFAILQIISCFIGCFYLDDKSNDQLNACSITNAVVYSILSIGYFVYSILLVCLLRWRFRRRSTRFLITIVVLTFLYLCASFIAFACIVLSYTKQKNYDIVLSYVFLILGDFIPQILVILLYGKGLTTSGYTSKKNRKMWESNRQLQATVV